MNTNLAKTRRRKVLFAFTIVVVGATIPFSAIMKGFRELSRELNVELVEDVGCTSRENKLIYVHIPKTGGSTIEQSTLFSDARLPRSHYTIGQMMRNAKERDIAHFETAATIRHPCERFISAFRYSISEKNRPQSQRDKAMEQIGERNIDEYVEYLEKNNWKEKKVLILMRSTMTGWLIDGEHDSFGVDTILCQEQWNEGIERLLNKIGITKNVTSLYQHKNQVSHHETCADLQPETRAALERYYAMDYCLFGYNSLPDHDNEQCIGTEHNKTTMTLRYRECQIKTGNKRIY